jgi:hypothetical protein
VRIVTILIAFNIVAFPRPAFATRFDDFDKMDAFDQAEFIATMVDIAETSLRKAGMPGAATRLVEAFAKYEPGFSASQGVAQLEVDIDKARNADADMQRKNPNSYSSRVHVQQAMVWTMEYFNVDVPLPVNNDLYDLMDAPAASQPFRPMTYAQFHAKAPDEQRRVIRTYAMTGYLDYLVRDVKKRGYKDSFLGVMNEAKVTDQLFEFVRSQFPAAGPQPGFEGAVKLMEPTQSGSRKGDGPMAGVVLYVIHHGEEILAARDKAIDERAVMIPDGRLVYPDKDGVFWTFDKDHNGVKLEQNLQPLAAALRRCMERRGLFAEKGLAACRQEVGISR